MVYQLDFQVLVSLSMKGGFSCCAKAAWDTVGADLISESLNSDTALSALKRRMKACRGRLCFPL